MKADTILKNFFGDNERFADLFNAALFHGEKILSSEDFLPQDTESSAVIHHQNHIQTIGRSRDIIKLGKGSSHGKTGKFLKILPFQNHVRMLKLPWTMIFFPA